MFLADAQRIHVAYLAKQKPKGKAPGGTRK
jgi:hypothetical protein